MLAGWYGGYAGGDSWKMNSGITSYEEKDDYYLFSGHSGSVYKCHKNLERFSDLMYSTYLFYKKGLAGEEMGTMEHLSFEAFMEEFMPS